MPRKTSKRKFEEPLVETKRSKPSYEELHAENQKLRQENHRLQAALDTSYVRLDELVQNRGLQHVALSIFKYLDLPSLANCRLVSKGWKECIDGDKFWWSKQLSEYVAGLRHYMFDRHGDYTRGRNYKDEIDEFIEACDYIRRNETLENLKLFSLFVWEQTLADYGRWSRLLEQSPLHYAVEKDRLDIFQILERSPMKKLDLKKWCIGSLGVLGTAIAKDLVEVIEFFMDLEGDRKIDFNDVWGSRLPTGQRCSLFMQACEADKIGAVKLFLKRAEQLNIDLNAKNSDSSQPYTAVMRARTKGVMELLLSDDRIDFGVVQLGYNVLHLVCKYEPEPGRYTDEEKIAETITILLQSPKVHYTSTPSGLTPLHIVARSSLKTKSRRVEAILKVALEKTANCVHSSRHGRSLRSTQKNIDVNAKDGSGKTPAHLAFERDFEHSHQHYTRHLFPSTLKELCPKVDVFLKYSKKLGIDLAATDNEGRTPFHLLCRSIGLGSHASRRVGVIGHFLRLAKEEYGVEFNLVATDNNGKTPLELFRLQ